MNIKVVRKIFTAYSVIGDMYVDDVFLCHTLEPADRGLDNTMNPDELKKLKVFGKTAIPTGEYKLHLRITDKFPTHPERGIPGTTIVPELENVPDYAGVWLHPGNYPSDTEGCTLVGTTIAENFIGNTWVAFELLKNKTFDAIKNWQAIYTITRDLDAYNNYKNKTK